jgi:hypothetical protein
MSSVYGNVITLTDKNTNEVNTLRFQANGTVTVTVNRNGRSVGIGGLWLLEPDNLTVCLQPSPLGGVAIPAAASCLPLAGHVVGDQWTASGATNQALSLTLSSSP